MRQPVVDKAVTNMNSGRARETMLNHSDIFLDILSTHGKGTSCACRSASLASDSVTATRILVTSVMVPWELPSYIIGASLSEPHTNRVYGCTSFLYVCVCPRYVVHVFSTHARYPLPQLKTPRAVSK